MKFFEKIANKLERNALSKEEKEAVKNIFNNFVFIEPKNFSVGTNNIKELSELVQEDFLNLKKRQKDSLISRETKRAEEIKNKKEVTGSELEKLSNKLVIDFSESLIEHFKNDNYFVMDDYQSWGFTPKLISEKLTEKDYFLKPNCFGIAMLRGVDNIQKGHSTFILCSVDHPEIMIKVDGKNYIDRGFLKGEKPLEITLETKENYEILRLPESSDETQKFFIVLPFVDGIMYEIFENLEVLKRLLNGGEVHGLPGTREEGLQLAKRFETELLACDWKRIQIKLFPQIYKAFKENKEEFNKEIEKVSNNRIKVFSTKILRDALEEAQKKTTYKDDGFESAQKKLLTASKQYKHEIEKFLINGDLLSESVQDDVKVFLKL